MRAAGSAIAHAVLVRQRAFEHVADDLHVAVAMRAEAGASGDAVFVDDPQVAHAHVLGVVVVGKGKAVKALEPAVVGVAAILGLAKCQHGDLSLERIMASGGGSTVQPRLSTQFN